MQTVTALPKVPTTVGQWLRGKGYVITEFVRQPALLRFDFDAVRLVVGGGWCGRDFRVLCRSMEIIKKYSEMSSNVDLECIMN